MKLWLKILWTAVIVITGTVAMVAVIDLFDMILNDFAINLEFFIALIGAILVALPAWFAWKGTKLVPIICNPIVRVVMIVIGCIVPILMIVFALIGIWLKS